MAEHANGPVPTLERVDYRLSPASINSYYRCPRKFQYRYLRRVRVPFVFKPALTIGGVAHKAMAEFFRDVRDNLPLQSVEAYADQYIRKEKYPAAGADELRAEHLPLIVGHVERGIESLPADYEIEAVEHEYDFAFRPPRVETDVGVVARVDLVVRHGDGMVDHIDFKTGGQGGDLIQNFLSRLTVANHLKMPSEKLRTVNVLTRSGSYEVVPSDRDQHLHTWDVVRGTISDLAHESAWNARPDPQVCRLCDFNLLCEAADVGSDD